MSFIFIYKDRYKIIISYLCGFLISCPNNAFGRRTFPVSWNSMFVFCSLKKKNKMLSWALSHLFFLALLGPLPLFFSVSSWVPLSPSPNPLPHCLDTCPATLGSPTFLLALKSLCSLTSEFHQPLSLPVSSGPLASKIGLDEQMQFQKETFFGFVSWKLVSREFTVLFSGLLFEVFDWKERDEKGWWGWIVVGIRIPDLSSNSETWTQTSRDPLCSLSFELEQHCIFFFFFGQC